MSDELRIAEVSTGNIPTGHRMISSFTTKFDVD